MDKVIKLISKEQLNYISFGNIKQIQIDKNTNSVTFIHRGDYDHITLANATNDVINLIEKYLDDKLNASVI